MDRCYFFRRFVQIILLVLAVVVLPRAAKAQPIRGAASAGYTYEIGGNVNTQMKIILGVLIFGMLFIALFSLYLRKCLDDSPALGIGSHRPSATTANNRARKFPCGLDSSVIETFPVFLYADVKKLKSGDHALECAVCIAEFADEDSLRLLPKCHHVFHPDCIDAWLASHTTCPVCRANLSAPDKLNGESEYNLDLTRIDGEEARSEQEFQNQLVIDVEEKRSTPKFPRSHSTGHSLVLPGGNCERYTLRLPEDVRKQIATLKRTKSCGCSVVVPRDGSSRRGWRGGGDGGSSRGGRRWPQDRLFGRSDRWTFTVTPPFIAKTGPIGKYDRAQSSSPSSSSGPPVSNYV